MENNWEKLYNAAKKNIEVKSIPPFIEYGNNSCAILTSNNNIYTGISIASNNSISNSAEKTAITSMLMSGENTIKKMVILNELEETILPSPDSFEYLVELTNNMEELEILINYSTQETINLKNLIPKWWGTYRNKKN
jgi:cytidine deaminase